MNELEEFLGWLKGGTATPCGKPIVLRLWMWESDSSGKESEYEFIGMSTSDLISRFKGIDRTEMEREKEAVRAYQIELGGLLEEAAKTE